EPAHPTGFILNECLALNDGYASKQVRFKLACQFCCSRHDDAMQWHVIVSRFQAVDEGATLESDAASILANVGVRVHALDRHRQFEFHPVVGLPGTFHSYIALFQVTGNIKRLS